MGSRQKVTSEKVEIGLHCSYLGAAQFCQKSHFLLTTRLAGRHKRKRKKIKNLITPPHISIKPLIMISSRSREAFFLPFTVKVSDGPLPVLSSLAEMRLQVSRIGQEVTNAHTQLRIDIPSSDFEQMQAFRLIEELKTVVEVIKARGNKTFYVIPKKTEEIQKDLIIRRYTNGVIDKVQSIERHDWANWSGCRIYPNGVMERGIFRRFRLRKGTQVENGVTTYCSPDILIRSFELDRGLIYANIENKIRLIVIRKKPDTLGRAEYIQAKEELIPTLANILQIKKDSHFDHHFKENRLYEILSGPIDCKQFFDFLFETHAIFSINLRDLQIILGVIYKNKTTVNIHQKHPITNQTLFKIHLENEIIRKKLLAIDPTLIQRKDGIESAFVQALLEGNTWGASILCDDMEEHNIPLLPRECLFKKVAFSREEVSVEDLQILSHEDQVILYRLANIYSRLPLLRTMRTLNFLRSEPLLMREGPSIFGCNMDALEMQETLQAFLTRLRSEKLLLTRSEFDEFPKDNYIDKRRQIGRILGRDYIEKKAHALGLKHVKVPKKMLVIDGNANLDVHISPSLDIVFSRNATVYAERIQESNRTITPEEAAELFRLFEATGFTDIHWGNVIVAKEGVYIIDTEFANFWVRHFYFANGGQYKEMTTIVHALPMEQQQCLIDELDAKIKTYVEHEQGLNEQRLLRLQAEEAALQQTGCCYGPRFTLPIQTLTI